MFPRIASMIYSEYSSRGDMLFVTDPEAVGGIVWWDADGWRWTSLR